MTKRPLFEVNLITQLLHVPIEVTEIRNSCLAGYWYCSEKARLQALGVNPPIPHFSTEAGTKFHNSVLTARNTTPLEQEFEEALKPFYQTGTDGQPVISRQYKNIKINADGTFLTHGVDEWKVEPNRDVWNIEYKTKACMNLQAGDISPARFQNKMACWLFDPIIKQINFNLRGGQIIYVRRDGRNGEFTEIGQTEKMFWNETAESLWLEEVEHILWSWNNPDKQIPCKRYKCLHCDPEYKSKCYFQTGTVWDGKS